MSPDRLVYMANQIGKFFAHEGEDGAAASVAKHLTLFWDPRMRSEIQGYVASGGSGLDPVVLNAVHRLKAVSKAI